MGGPNNAGWLFGGVGIARSSDGFGGCRVRRVGVEHVLPNMYSTFDTDNNVRAFPHGSQMPIKAWKGLTLQVNISFEANCFYGHA